MNMRKRQLGEIATIFTGFPTASSGVERTPEAATVLTVKCIAKRGIDADQALAIEAPLAAREKYSVRAGDVLLPSRSTSLKIAIVPPELDGVLINSTVIGIRCLPQLDPHLLAAYFQHPEGQAAVERVSQSGTFQMNITVRALSTVTIPVPDIPSAMLR